MIELVACNLSNVYAVIGKLCSNKKSIINAIPKWTMNVRWYFVIYCDLWLIVTWYTINKLSAKILFCSSAENCYSGKVEAFTKDSNFHLSGFMYSFILPIHHIFFFFCAAIWVVIEDRWDFFRYWLHHEQSQ